MAHSDRDHLRIIFWNVKWLSSPNKRMQILRHLKRLRADVVLLQETHLPTDDLPRLRKLWVEEVYGSLAIGRKAGVAILLQKNLRHTIRDIRADSTGCKITLHLSLASKDIAITNIYTHIKRGFTKHSLSKHFALKHDRNPEGTLFLGIDKFCGHCRDSHMVRELYRLETK